MKNFLRDKLSSGFIFWLFWVGLVDIFCSVTAITPPPNMNEILTVAVALVAVLLPPLPTPEQVKTWLTK